MIEGSDEPAHAIIKLSLDSMLLALARNTQSRLTSIASTNQANGSLIAASALSFSRLDRTPSIYYSPGTKGTFANLTAPSHRSGDAVKSIQVDSHVFEYLKAHGMGAGQSATDVLRSLLLHTIEIDDELHAYLMSLASAPGETANTILRRELDIDESPAQPPALIEFHIAAGTGSNPWNTRDTAVMGTVGQTLRIHNDDTVPHRLHTNGIPFLHAANDTAPGTFSDFVLMQPFNLDAPGIYDHNFGQGARFWIGVQPEA